MLTFFIKRPRFAMVIALVITLLGAEDYPGGAVSADHAAGGECLCQLAGGQFG